jgi:hypothetical protein
MMFHDQLWAHMAFNGQIIQKGIPRDLGLLFLRALFDQRQTNSLSHTDFIASSLDLPGMLETSGRFVAIEKTKVDCEDEPVTLCGLPSLVKKFHEMAKNKVYYSRIGILKEDKAEEIRKVVYSNKKFEKEITFTPAINGYSKTLSQINDEKLRKSMNIDCLDKTKERIEILYTKNTLKEQQLEDKRMKQMQEKLQECTFQPNLTKTKDYNGGQMNRSTSSVVDRLYETRKGKFEMLDQIRREKLQKKELAELNHCTFFPKTNEIDRIEDLRAIYDQTNLPRDYHKTIGRLRVANEKYVEKKKKLEHIPTGENLEKFRTMQFTVPNCADVDRKVKNRIPFVQFDVKLGGGR